MKIIIEIDKNKVIDALDTMVKVNDSMYVTLLTAVCLKDENGNTVFKCPLLDWFIDNAEKKTMRDLVTDEDIERWMNGKE